MLLKTVGLVQVVVCASLVQVSGRHLTKILLYGELLFLCLSSIEVCEK